MSSIERAPLRRTFTTRHVQYIDYIGQPFEVLQRIDAPSIKYDADILPMYRIRFRDGKEIDAWPDEVEESVRRSHGGRT